MSDTRNRVMMAFTLPELVIGMTITALVGLSTGAVSRVLSGNYSQSQNYYQSLQNARVAMMRIESEVRQAKLVTEAATGELMLWQEPAGGDGYINLSELRCIAVEGNHVSAYSVVFPAWWPAYWKQLMDSQIDLQSLLDSPAAWASSIINYSYTVKTRLADNITSFSTAADPAAPLATLVTVKVSSGSGATACGLRSTVCLRNDRTSSVARAGSDYVLMGGS